MAEIFGTVAGAMSIAGLFNNCVDCFNYIQIAKHFGQDFSRYQLRLDVAKCRLTRWGASIDINNDRRFSLAEPADPTVILAQDILKEIVARFETARKISKRYETRTEEQGLRICTEADLGPVSQRLYSRFDGLSKQRYETLGLIKKTGWALYDKTYMGRMIDDIIASIEDLEKVFPGTPQLTSQLVEMEIEEVNNEQELELIQDIAEGVDPVLSYASKNKVQELPARIPLGGSLVQEELILATPLSQGRFQVQKAYELVQSTTLMMFTLKSRQELILAILGVERGFGTERYCRYRAHVSAIQRFYILFSSVISTHSYTKLHHNFYLLNLDKQNLNTTYPVLLEGTYRKRLVYFCFDSLTMAWRV